MGGPVDRYYTPQFERPAHMLLQVRDAGVPVDTMRAVQDGPTDRVVEILQGFATRAAESARHAALAVAVGGPELASLGHAHR